MPVRRALIALSFLPALSLADVHYTLAPEPQSKSARVSITIDNPKAQETFRIPAWCPGFYFLLKYQDKISDFKAVDADGHPLDVEHKLDPRQWKVSDPGAKPMTVSYRVLGDDPGLGFFGTSVLEQTAFVNGPSAFMYDVDRLTEPAKLRVTLPEGWDLATTMDEDKPDADNSHPQAPPSETNRSEGWGFRAGGYDELIDHPIQMGHFERRKFSLEGIPYEVVFVSKDQKYRPDLDAETARLKAVALPALKLFGGAQFKKYIFFIHLAVGDFNGGLEHRACNVQAVNNFRPLGIDDLAAHEYFHAWNVKQIRPKVLGPFDYTKEQRTANLWFAEGVTDYYAKITTYRSGLQDLNWLLNDLSRQVDSLQRGKMRHEITLADTSRRAWENGGFGVGDLSYYVKGLLVGWIFDAAIRDATDGEKSLDDVMRIMYKRYHLPQAGYDEDAILKTINEVSGSDFTALYNRMVNSTEELPFEMLEKIGITVDPQSARVTVDQQADQKAADLRKAWLDRPGGIR